ncbi:PAS domain S-box protein [Bacillus sp. AGMB 02131]|uniref:histidine kinase n=1 Tax=Peribacillus faecalis TaxID=2772559 RepID=A0A927H9I6_9BACI|nr:PAS domain S-box protein [Peribacillus faecalis]MBD3106929.1 PAS domain S-box protein [Peribacillus faecalis]
MEFNGAYIEDKVDEQMDEAQFKAYHFFFHSSKSPLMVVNRHLEIIQLNHQAKQLFMEIARDTYDQSWSLKNLLEQIPLDILEDQLKLVRSQGSYKDEWLFLNQQNTYKHIEFQAQFDGNLYYFTLRDITAIKKQEKDYMISAGIFKDIFTLVTEGMMILDKDGSIIEANRAFLSLVMIDKPEFVGRKFYEFLQADSKRKWLNEWGVLKDLGKISSTFEWSFAGKSYYFKCTIYRNVYKDQYICVLKDVTEKKLIELHLKSSKEIFSYVFDQANEAIVLLDEKGYIYEANDVACRLFEASRNELIGMRSEDLLVKKDRKYWHSKKTFLEKGSIRQTMFHRSHKGKDMLLEVSSKRINEGDRAVTIYRNVSERYEMERKLRRSEKQFRRIFEGMLDGLLLWNKNGIIDINEACLSILNMEKKHLVRKTVPEIIKKYPEHKEWIEKISKDLGDNKSPNMLMERITLARKDGSIKHVEVLTKRNLFSGMNLTVLRDETEKLIMQEQIRKSDTLNVVGELAAGIAHEIRNPMTALKGFIQLLEASVKEDYSKYFSIITSELKRIDTIITDFLVLAKPQAVQYVEKDLNVIVKETIGLLNGEALLFNIDLIPKLSENPIELYCEPNQLKQVLINLVKNAIESMKNGGRVFIRTESCNDRNVRLIVSDEGCGIPEKKLKRLGEPFYTTKERGTGLGLMMSYKIIKEHGGEIDVISEVGVGTTFSIKLPLRCNND